MLKRHGFKDYGDHLLFKMADQLKLTKKELLSFINGKMTSENYKTTSNHSSSL